MCLRLFTPQSVNKCSHRFVGPVKWGVFRCERSWVARMGGGGLWRTVRGDIGEVRRQCVWCWALCCGMKWLHGGFQVRDIAGVCCEMFVLAFAPGAVHFDVGNVYRAKHRAKEIAVHGVRWRFVQPWFGVMLVWVLCIGCTRTSSTEGKVGTTEEKPLSEAKTSAVESENMKASVPDFTPLVSLLETAQNAKAGAVLLLGSAQVPLYLQGLSSWPQEHVAKEVRVEGTLTYKSEYLPEAKVSDRGAISQGVAPGASGQWVFETHSVTTEIREPEAVPFALLQQAWPKYNQCLGSIASVLSRAKDTESASEFCVGTEVKTQGDSLVFALWHQDSFLPNNKNVLGNPGGQSRNAFCSASSMKFQKFLFWQ